MAKTSAGSKLTRQQRQRQLQIRAAALRQMLLLWPAFKLVDLATFDTFVAATLPLLRLRHQESSQAAGVYYQSFRRIEGVEGTPPIRLAPFNPDKAVASLYVTGKHYTEKQLRAKVGTELVRNNALVRVSGAVARLVLDGGRETLVETIKADRRARGYQRVTSGSACDFCQMLAGRGAVYGAESGEFQSHDHCACGLEPAF